MPFAGTEADLRKAKRYPMSAAVTFCWNPGVGTLEEGRGTTLDISSNGVFVITEAAPRAGDRLELEICLRLSEHEFKFVRFHGEGKVVRTIKGLSQSGFAAEVLFQTESINSPLSGVTRIYGRP